MHPTITRRSSGQPRRPGRTNVRSCPDSAQALALCIVLVALLLPMAAGAHNVAADDLGHIQSISGPQPAIFAYLGAKHMVSGYDHLLYLLAIVFFLYRLREVAAYVTLFAIGHSSTLLFGVLGGIWVNPFIVDAIIGLSVVYKAFENIGGFRKVVRLRINPKIAVLCFGLCHGFGLATKLQDLSLSKHGLLANMIAFNFGVELGQLAALGLIVMLINVWRATPEFGRGSFYANVALMSAGFSLTGYQLAGLLMSS